MPASSSRIVTRNHSHLTELFWRRIGRSVQLPRSPWSPASGKFSSNCFLLLLTRSVAVFYRQIAAYTCSHLKQITELKRCSFEKIDLMFTFGGGRVIAAIGVDARTPADVKLKWLFSLKRILKACRSVILPVHVNSNMKRQQVILQIMLPFKNSTTDVIFLKLILSWFLL